MVDKNTNKKRIITSYLPDGKVPINEPKPTPPNVPTMNAKQLQQEVLRRAFAGQSIRRIASELGISFAQATKMIGAQS
ncbi:MAG: hypothetical protein AAFV93_09585 [Chloroflexota bacterium]